MKVLPKSLLILDALDIRFKRMLKSNDFSFDIRKVERSRLTNFAGRDMPALTYLPFIDEPNGDATRNQKRVLRIEVGYSNESRGDNATNVILMGQDLNDGLLQNENGVIDCEFGGLIDDIKLGEIQYGNYSEDNSIFYFAKVGVDIFYKVKADTLT